jgi:hypothetical protein
MLFAERLTKPVKEIAAWDNIRLEYEHALRSQSRTQSAPTKQELPPSRNALQLSPKTGQYERRVSASSIDEVELGRAQPGSTKPRVKAKKIRNENEIASPISPSYAHHSGRSNNVWVKRNHGKSQKMMANGS